MAKTKEEPAGDDPESSTVSRSPAEEIAQRTADNDVENSDRYVKEFVAGVPASSIDTTDWDEFDHGPNIASVVQDAINAGLRLKGEVRFEHAKAHPQGGIVMRYSAPAIPARLVGDDGQMTTDENDVLLEEVLSPKDVIESDNPEAAYAETQARHAKEDPEGGTES